MFTFNTADVVGKLLAAVPYAWSRRQLTLMSTLRALLIPLLLLCVAPRKNPTISGELPAFMFTIAFGISNGLAGSLPMLMAPQKVAAPLKEMAGNIMTVSYMVGLTVGSLVGYVFENMLGSPISNPCPSYPFIPKPIDELAVTTTATTSTIGSTTIATSILTSILSTQASTLTPTQIVQHQTSTASDLSTNLITSTLQSVFNASILAIVNATSSVH
jgi:solute carrier family 29 (equilibrative nucleoside transporter) protein 4